MPRTLCGSKREQNEYTGNFYSGKLAIERRLILNHFIIRKSDILSYVALHWCRSFCPVVSVRHRDWSSHIPAVLTSGATFWKMDSSEEVRSVSEEPGAQMELKKGMSIFIDVSKN